jgi:hypothetical protein
MVSMPIAPPGTLMGVVRLGNFVTPLVLLCQNSGRLILS